MVGKGVEGKVTSIAQLDHYTSSAISYSLSSPDDSLLIFFWGRRGLVSFGGNFPSTGYDR
jgi:hypothetical protein